MTLKKASMTYAQSVGVKEIFPLDLEVVVINIETKRNPWRVSGYVKNSQDMVVIKHADGKEIQCYTKNLKRRFTQN